MLKISDGKDNDTNKSVVYSPLRSSGQNRLALITGQDQSVCLGLGFMVRVPDISNFGGCFILE
jgi:hypothetical protein